jgi:hypothetical protein
VAFRYAVLYLDILPRNSSRQRWINSAVAET